MASRDALKMRSRRLPRSAAVVGLAAAMLAAPSVQAKSPHPAPLATAPNAPLTVQSSLRLARAFRTSGDPVSAIALYRAVLAQKNADPGVKVELGDTLVDAGMVDDAIGLYGQIDPKSPDAPAALLGLASAELRLGQPGKALDFADRSLAAGPNNERAQVARGVALDNLGRHAEAQAAYRMALAQSPSSVPARSDLALSLAVTGRFQEAIDLLGPIARSTNATPRLRQNLAFVYGLKGDRDAALSLSRADLDPASAEANQRFFDLVRQAGSKPTVNLAQ